MTIGEHTTDSDTEANNIQKPQTLDELLTVQEACKILKCGPTRLYQFINSRQLVSFKMGRSRRIPRSAIDAFIKKL